MTRDEEVLLEQVVSAHRERARDGRIASHPAWHDLDAAGRAAAFTQTLLQRALERAADAQGLTSTAKALMARLATAAQ